MAQNPDIYTNPSKVDAVDEKVHLVLQNKKGVNSSLCGKSLFLNISGVKFLYGERYDLVNISDAGVICIIDSETRIPKTRKNGKNCFKCQKLFSRIKKIYKVLYNRF